MRPISVAPMMDRTDRHFRWFIRQISRRALLYTEMVTMWALEHGDRDKLLGYDPLEHPIAAQLGGDDPAALARCARVVEDHGYDEVNLNVGCPSDRVQAGCFGAMLMKRPERVAEAVAAMRHAVDIPVTVKHRIGVDDADRYEDLVRFVEVVAPAAPDRFTVHARKAWLQGLSPRENRNIPPLRYGDVHRLKAEHPELVVEINGGLGSLSAYTEQLRHVDAVMVGRAAYDDPFHFIGVDPTFFGVAAPHETREEVARAVVPYLAHHVEHGHRPHHVLRHMANLYAGVPGARAWRRCLGTVTSGQRPAEGVIEAALDAVASAQPPAP